MKWELSQNKCTLDVAASQHEPLVNKLLFSKSEDSESFRSWGNF